MYYSAMLYLPLCLLWAAAAARPATDRPNFVMLFVDDMGYGDPSFNGNTSSAPTPNIDDLAFRGKILTTWYSGCPICTGSRAALMTGRQFPRTGLPGGIGPAVPNGLPLSETTIAEQLKKADYATAAVGKWHLGQRRVYLPGNRGFDRYLGIPYSNDMGNSLMSQCPTGSAAVQASSERLGANQSSWNWKPYYEAGYLEKEDVDLALGDPAALWLPLIKQEGTEMEILEQPLDLTPLAEKYSDFAVDFIHENKDKPFFLYVPFSHVHKVHKNDKHGEQYASCRFRGKHSGYGDAMAETDWIVGNIRKALQDAGVEENTLILFTGDNGPWLEEGGASGSTGVLTGSYAGYWNVGKGSTWEGGIRSASFASWKGQIEPHSRSSEVISSLDVFPTLSKLAGVGLDPSRVYDGHDMSEVLLQKHGRSKHDFLFFYGGCSDNGPSAVRYGQWKAHFCTGPGLGGCEKCGAPGCKECQREYYQDVPLLFDVVKDPGEATPLNSKDRPPKDKEAAEVLERIITAYKTERATFKYGHQRPEPGQSGESRFHYGLCCSRRHWCNCPTSKEGRREKSRRQFRATSASKHRRTRAAPGGFLSIGTPHYHDAFHDVMPSTV